MEKTFSNLYWSDNGAQFSTEGLQNTISGIQSIISGLSNSYDSTGMLNYLDNFVLNAYNNGGSPSSAGNNAAQLGYLAANYDNYPFNFLAQVNNAFTNNLSSVNQYDFYPDSGPSGQANIIANDVIFGQMYSIPSGGTFTTPSSGAGGIAYIPISMPSHGNAKIVFYNPNSGTATEKIFNIDDINQIPNISGAGYNIASGISGIEIGFSGTTGNMGLWRIMNNTTTSYQTTIMLPYPQSNQLPGL